MPIHELDIATTFERSEVFEYRALGPLPTAAALGLGQELEGAGERLQLMLREMERLCDDPGMERDRDRLRQMDRLQKHLQLMIREMDETRETLRDVAAAP